VTTDRHSILVSLRDTTESELDYVMALERDPENSPYIRQWTRRRHLRSLTDKNEAHFIVESQPDRAPQGYAILIGLTDPDKSLQIKRVVISDKGRGYGRAAMRAIKEYAFLRVGCHRLWLEVVEGYDRARELYQSEGFTVEGLLRDGLRRAEDYVSLNVMSILDCEYSQTRGEKESSPHQL
jgi:diamine N-acetyltransferase